MALTDTAIRTAKPQAKPYKLSDSGGLYLEVAPSGGKWWRYKYRFNGKENRISLGTYPDTPLASQTKIDETTGKKLEIKGAREKHADARKLLAQGINPSEDRKATKATDKLNSANSFELIAREWWQSHMKGKAESHKEKVIRRFELYLFPWIGSKPIATITAPQVLDAIKRIEKLNKLETAHRTLQAAGQVFRYAVSSVRRFN